ncbi:MAG: PQQ-binding-like beta-propeller repeat protein [Treponema sp.]|jgi:outer membrane protein assembly factor BamB|nr:PQQ-binding-like beta-propeller repeat protein [Treponema sp.]
MMMKLPSFFILSFLACAALLCGCSRRADWLRFRGEEGRGLSAARISPPLGVRWKIKLQPDEGQIDAFNPPVVAGNTIYFGSGDGNFYALDAETGYMRWIFKSGAEINSIPCVDSSQAYFGSKDGKLYALSRETGQEMWNFPVNSQINSQVERYKDYVIFVGDSDAIYFLSSRGDEQFRIYNPGWYNFTFNVTDDVMYFATGPQVSQVGPFDINRREFLWFVPYYEIAASWYSFAAVRKDLVYFGTAEGYDGSMELGYYAYDRLTGEEIWEQRREGVFDSSWDGYDIARYYVRNVEMLDFMAPTIWKNLVIYTGGDSVARAFNAETGIPRWERVFDTPIASTSTVAGGRLYFGLLGDDINPSKLVCLHARDGRLLWSMETEGSLLSSPVIAGKRIVFGTDKSVFYVLEEVF